MQLKHQDKNSSEGENNTFSTTWDKIIYTEYYNLHKGSKTLLTADWEDKRAPTFHLSTSCASKEKDRWKSMIKYVKLIAILPLVKWGERKLLHH